MSDALSVAVWRARMAKRTPIVVNRYVHNDVIVAKLEAANGQIALLQQQNTELRGQNGGLTTRVRQLATMLDSMTRERNEAIASLDNPSILLRGKNTLPRLAHIIMAVSEEFDIPVAFIRSMSRTPNVAEARQVTMYLARKLAAKSLPAIGRFLDRDHSSILHGVRKIESLRKHNSELNAKIERIEERFKDALLAMNTKFQDAPAPGRLRR